MQSGLIGRDIIGHATVIRLLNSWAKTPGHGYVFFGPAHLGKRTVAEQFVAALLDVDAMQRSHPDLILLEPVEGKNIISVEQVREARASLAGRPMVASRRVFFIPSADRLNEEGMNALLKVLEEPPAGAVFVFVTENLSRLPATVRSRMVAVPFASVATQEIVAGLVARNAERGEAERLAEASRGRPGRAIEPQERSDVAKKFFDASSVGERLFLIELLTKLCESSEEPSDAWRSALDDLGEAVSDRLASASQTALVIGEATVTARRFVGGALSPRLPLEAAALRLSSANPLLNLFPSHLPQSLPRIFA